MTTAPRGPEEGGAGATSMQGPSPPEPANAPLAIAGCRLRSRADGLTIPGSLHPGLAHEAAQLGAERKEHARAISRSRRGALGEGGMSIVYRAEQDDPRRTVALKVMRAGL